MPLGISFLGTAFSEPALIRLASGYEAFTQTRAQNLPTFVPMLPSDHLDGTTVSRPPRRGNAVQKAIPAPVRDKRMPHGV